jgi:hypothetical protein
MQAAELALAIADATRGGDALAIADATRGGDALAIAAATRGGDALARRPAIGHNSRLSARLRRAT